MISCFCVLLQVYCSSHVPKSGPGHLDNTSVGIRQALNAPRTNKFVNEQIRGTRSEVDGKLRTLMLYSHFGYLTLVIAKLF